MAGIMLAGIAINVGNTVLGRTKLPGRKWDTPFFEKIDEKVGMGL